MMMVVMMCKATTGDCTRGNRERYSMDVVKETKNLCIVQFPFIYSKRRENLLFFTSQVFFCLLYLFDELRVGIKLLRRLIKNNKTVDIIFSQQFHSNIDVSNCEC